jgi:hypothetical protein
MPMTVRDIPNRTGPHAARSFTVQSGWLGWRHQLGGIAFQTVCLLSELVGYVREFISFNV